MAAYRRVDDLTVTCRLTACTPGSAPGPTLGVEYGKPLRLPFSWYSDKALRETDPTGSTNFAKLAIKDSSYRIEFQTTALETAKSLASINK